MRKRMRLECFTVLLAGLWGFTAANGYERTNPPYPRIAVYTTNQAGGWPNYSIGTRLLRLKPFDMVLIGLSNDINGPQLARELRKNNPNQLIIGMGRNGVYFNDPPEFYLYRSYQGRLRRRIEPGQSKIYVDSISGIDSGCETNIDLIYAVIDNDVVKVTALPNDTTISVPTDVSSIYAINSVHEAGAVVKSPIRLSGAGVLANYSEFCPQVGGRNASQYLAWDNLVSECDWSLGDFDGLFHDYFHYRIYYQGTLDMNNNGVNDRDEWSKTQLLNYWQNGLAAWIDDEKAMMQSLAPTALNLFSVNPGGVLDMYYERMNGHLFEGFLRWALWTSVQGDANKWSAQGQKPSLMFIEDYIPEKWAANGKDRFSKMRFGLATSLMFDCYYGLVFGANYRFPYWYDEYETDLGYPVGAAETLSNGVVIRYFDKGAAACNPTGATQTLNPGDLRGGPYYRLKAGQDAAVNTGLLVDAPISLYGQLYNADDLRGDGILLFKAPTTAVSDIIVDNSYNNDTSPGSQPVEVFGNWKIYQSTGSLDLSKNNPYWSITGAVSGDSDYLISGGYHGVVAGSGADSARYRPTIGVAGYYEVSEWHGWYGGSDGQYAEATNVPFKIVVTGAVKLRGLINQRIQAGQWNRLGYVYLPAGSQSYVHLSNATNGPVIADAMRFRYMGDHVDPDTTPPQAPKNVKLKQQ